MLPLLLCSGQTDFSDAVPVSLDCQLVKEFDGLFFLFQHMGVRIRIMPEGFAEIARIYLRVVDTDARAEPGVDSGSGFQLFIDTPQLVDMFVFSRSQQRE